MDMLTRQGGAIEILTTERSLGILVSARNALPTVSRRFLRWRQHARVPAIVLGISEDLGWPDPARRPGQRLVEGGGFAGGGLTWCFLSKLTGGFHRELFALALISKAVRHPIVRMKVRTVTAFAYRVRIGGFLPRACKRGISHRSLIHTMRLMTVRAPARHLGEQLATALQRLLKGQSAIDLDPFGFELTIHIAIKLPWWTQRRVLGSAGVT